MSVQADKLLYRRQFILAPGQIEDFSSWKILNVLNNYFIHIHPDLRSLDYSENNKRIILIGDLYDPENIRFDNEEIISRLINENDILKVIESSSRLAGRFALFFINNSNIFLFNDASASRKVYFSYKKPYMWVASQPHVLAKYAKIDKAKKVDVIDFYNSDAFREHNMASILDNTAFQNIKQLLPNKYLDFQDGQVKRFWPNKKRKEISLNEGVEEGSKMLSNIISSANERNNLMTAITAGNDTRLILAASREVSSDIYYYIIWLNHFSEKHQDIRIPSKLLDKVGLKFNIIKPENDINSEFKSIYFTNNIFANKYNLPIVYQFYKNFSDKTNMPGRFSDISRGFLNTYRKKVNPKLLAKIWEYDNNEYVITNYRKWLSEVSPLLNRFDYSILDVFNWEERNGNWYTQYQIDKDIAQEEFTPYNCRRLMEVFLSVPSKYRDVHTNIYYRAMIKKLWPELMTEPFNPNLKKYSSYYLKKTGLYWGVRRLTRSW